MPEKKFDLGDYVEVKDRIARFYELFGQGRLVTEEVTLTTEPDGKPRVMVKALAYRTPDDPHPAPGYSWMELPGTTTYTRGSELENTETSAIGRAIGFLGILIDKSIASQQEVANKQDDRPELDRPVDGLIGTAEVGKTRDSDFELRETPDGWALGFRLTQGRTGFKVLSFGPLAQALATLRPTIEGQRVTVWGTMVDEKFTNAKGVDITYKVVHADRVATPEGVIPSVDHAEYHRDEPPTEPVEAESAPLPWEPLDEAEKAAITAGLPA
ncbi:MAG: hypothetical protein H0W36_00525 [Gemmatimonadetes bacterium]|nr:hypothetical protein [Gemmatimonadota bacterium]